MGDTLQLEHCPETGICSIVRAGGAKVDLMPDEVAAVRDAAGDPDGVRAAIAESDAGFAAGLTAEELAELGARI